MKKFFGILGGMGTLATTNFLVEMNKRHFPENDQDYFNYILMNHADIPDRTEYHFGSDQTESGGSSDRRCSYVESSSARIHHHALQYYPLFLR